MKLCSAPGCDEVAVEGHLCPDCTVERAARRKVSSQEAKGSAIARKGSKLYDRKWRKAREAYLARHPLCRHCAELGLTVAATDVDHIEPHRGDRTLFWKTSNWQPLCHACHARKTAGEVWHGQTGGGSEI